MSKPVEITNELRKQVRYMRNEKNLTWHVIATLTNHSEKVLKKALEQ